MPGGLGDLVVNLGAKTNGLKKGVAESKASLSSFASAATSILNPVTAAFAAMAAGVASVGVAVYGLNGRIEALDKVAKDAQKTGVSGAFLQQLTFAADQSGVSVDTLTASLKKMTILIGQASEGNKTAAASMDALGLSAYDLQALSPEEQFKRIADNISKLPSAAQRAAAAVSVFGKSGIEMTTLFGGGLNDINRLMEEARALGIGVSEEGLAKIQAANDAIGAMKAAFSALIDQLAVGIAPVFTAIADYIKEWIPPITEVMAKFNELEGKIQFLGDLMAAAFDVGIATIEAHWSAMVQKMMAGTAKAAIKIAELMNPVTALKVGGELLANSANGGEANQNGETGLAAAQARLQALIDRLNTPRPPDAVKPQHQRVGVPFQIVEKSDAAKAAEWFGGLFEQAAPWAKFAAGVGEKMGAAIASPSIGGVVAEKDPVKIEPRYAGAMQRGSTEAYSTILAAMRGSRDPVVAATEKQTKDLIKGLKPAAAPVKMVAEFAV